MESSTSLLSIPSLDLDMSLLSPPPKQKSKTSHHNDTHDMIQSPSSTSTRTRRRRDDYFNNQAKHSSNDSSSHVSSYLQHADRLQNQILIDSNDENYSIEDFDIVGEKKNNCNIEYQQHHNDNEQGNRNDDDNNFDNKHSNDVSFTDNLQCHHIDEADLNTRFVTTNDDTTFIIGNYKSSSNPDTDVVRTEIDNSNKISKLSSLRSSAHESQTSEELSFSKLVASLTTMTAATTRTRTTTATVSKGFEIEASNMIKPQTRDDNTNTHEYDYMINETSKLIGEAETYLEEMKMIQVKNAILMDSFVMIGAKVDF
mmetsp:Transcript_25353/g.31240  ORF Transcript_25353/g.31240 Transcript_25353/m.31240 type:complete len:313 (-) Transcript_25353:247-1185(-)